MRLVGKLDGSWSKATTNLFGSGIGTLSFPSSSDVEPSAMKGANGFRPDLRPVPKVFTINSLSAGVTMTRCLARPLLAISSLALIAGPSFSAWAGGGACSGPLSQEHPLADADFYTNSVIRPNQDGSTKDIYPYVTKSCVVSAHVNASPLRVKWFAPKIFGWLNDDTSPIPIDIPEIDQPRLMDGCLEYGYQSLSIKASFGDSDAQKKVDRENEVGCRQIAAEGSGNAGQSKSVLRS